ncbi:MAG: glycosyltransferase [Crocinitomicaceae bacterium]|nr:glycosyltransferase [Crocinitomicaceae bacterium]
MSSFNPSKKPVLAVILSRFPFPLEKGDKLRAYYQIKDLSKHFDIELICISDIQVTQENQNQLKDYCKNMHVFELRKIGIIWSLFKGIFNKKPFQVQYFYQPWIQRKINEIVLKSKPEHIYCQLVRSSEYVKNYHECKKTLDYMDALSKGIERRKKSAFGLKKELMKMESKRLTAYERSIFDYFEFHTIISKQDRQFILHPKQKKIQIIPNGVDQKFFEFTSKKPHFDLVFTGNMSYPPNIEAALYIKNQLMPLLEKQLPTIQCLISGVNPTNILKKCASDNFIVSGWVEDIRDSYANAKIFIAPMMLGTGLQNKLLEAMAMGLPCITTTLANNALNAIPNQQILIADTENEFINQVNLLMNDVLFYQRIAENGQAFVKENYQWSVINDRLIGMIQSE